MIPDGSKLQEAIEALRRQDTTRAKDILSGLLKDEPNNVEYWVWMSAAVETAKERLYCLQTAARLDPENAAARRGLRLLGALPPDDSLPPFPLNQPRTWLEDLYVAGDQPSRGGRLDLSSPEVRLFGLLGLGLLAFAALVFLFVAPRRLSPLIAPGPPPTFTFTPTSLTTSTPVVRTATPTFIGPTPLWMFLDATYTPTPLYVNVTHSISFRDVHRAAMLEFRNGNWALAVTHFEQLLFYEPGAVDAHYYIGEIHRFTGEYSRALQSYDRAIAMDRNFGAAYLGRARTRLLLNPGADILGDLNRAVELAPDFAETYLERAAYYLGRNNLTAARRDLMVALDLAPLSPSVHLWLARLHLAAGEAPQALQAALQANELDLTLLPVYLVLGQAYQANGQLDKAVGAMQAYVLYQPEDARALLILGAAYAASGDYPAAEEMLTRALSYDSRLGEAYLQRGLVYLQLREGRRAENDLRAARQYLPESFDLALGIARAQILQERFGDGYLQVERSRALAQSDMEMAQVYYWRAICLEALNNLPAAYRDWQALLALPAGAMPPEWRVLAEQHMTAIRTPTPTSGPPAATVTPTP
jgi:tetratricopeptide (TPR) repeat protein